MWVLGLASWVHFCLSAGNVGVGAQDLLLGSWGWGWRGRGRIVPLACRLGSQSRAVNSLLLHSSQTALVWDGAASGRGGAGSLQRCRGESQRPDQVEEDGRGTRWGWRPEGKKEQESAC